jgi:hypothetical protein
VNSPPPKSEVIITNFFAEHHIINRGVVIPLNGVATPQFGLKFLTPRSVEFFVFNDLMWDMVVRFLEIARLLTITA